MASQNGTRARVLERKRGRPSGKSRIPLSLEERRNRNAAYERERRAEQTQLLSQIAESIGCDPKASNLEVLDAAINYLKQFEGTDVDADIQSLRRINDNLINQIASCEQRLGIPSGSDLNEDSYIKKHSNNARYQPAPENGLLPQGLITTNNGFCLQNNYLYEMVDLPEVDYVFSVPDHMREWSIDDFIHTYLNTLDL